MFSPETLGEKDYSVLDDLGKSKNKIRKALDRLRGIGLDVDENIANDFDLVTGHESGRVHYSRPGQVKRGVATKSGERAIGYSQIMPSTARKYKKYGLDPFNETDNIAMSMVEFQEGSDDPIGRRIAYVGGSGSKALKHYKQTGEVPDWKLYSYLPKNKETFKDYVEKTGGFADYSVLDRLGTGISLSPSGTPQVDFEVGGLSPVPQPKTEDITAFESKFGKLPQTPKQEPVLDALSQEPQQPPLPLIQPSATPEQPRIGQVAKDIISDLAQPEQQIQGRALGGEQPTLPENLQGSALSATQEEFRKQKGYSEYKKFIDSQTMQEGTSESIEAFNHYQQLQQTQAQRTQQINRPKGAAAKQVQGQYDFEKTGELHLPQQMGQNPVMLTYDKTLQGEGLKKGEYRLFDEDGTAFIFNPKTGAMADEAGSTIVKEIDVSLLPPETKTVNGKKMAERIRANEIADALVPDYPDVPREDMVDYFQQAGFVDWENKQPVSEEKFYQSTSQVDPLTGAVAKTEKHHLTQLDINRMLAFSQDRQETQAIYDSSKQFRTEQGEDIYAANVNARADAGWISRKKADEELAVYETKRKEMEESARLSLLSQAELGASFTPEQQKQAIAELSQKALKDIQQKYGTFAAQKEADERYAKLPLGEKIRSTASALGQVLTKGAEAVSKVAGTAQFSINNLFTNIPSEKYNKLEDTLFWQGGEEWKKLGEWAFPIHKDAKENWTVKTADTIGQVITMAGLTYGTGGLGPAAVYGLSLGASEQMTQAGKEGATPAQQIGRGVVGAIAAMPDLLFMKLGFKNLLPAQKISWTRALGLTIAKTLAPKVGEETAEQIAKTGIRAFITKMAVKGEKILLDVEKESFKPLTVGGAITRFGIGTVGEGVQEWQENDINLVAKKLIQNPEITWADILAISPEDVESAKYGALGGFFGAGINVLTHPTIQKALSDKMSNKELASTTDILNEQVKQGLPVELAQQIQASAQKILNARRSTITLKPIETQNAEIQKQAESEAVLPEAKVSEPEKTITGLTKELADEPIIPDRPTLTMGDMEGMAPENRQVVLKEKDISYEYDPETGDIFAFKNGREIGFATGLSEDITQGFDISVAQEFQRQGVGSRLFELYRDKHPDAPIGGLTEQGRAMVSSIAQKQTEPEREVSPIRERANAAASELVEKPSEKLLLTTLEESARMGERRKEQLPYTEEKRGKIVSGGELTREGQKLESETERRQIAERQAETDALTGLANRAALDKALPEAEKDQNTAVIAFDANNFGKINKVADQETGDRALIEVADAIKQAAEENGITRIFRRGGDEFVVLAPKDVANKIQARAEEIYGEKDYAGIKVSLSGTIGNTFKEADSILQAAKAERKTQQPEGLAKTPETPVETKQELPPPEPPPSENEDIPEFGGKERRFPKTLEKTGRGQFSPSKYIEETMRGWKEGAENIITEQGLDDAEKTYFSDETLSPAVKNALGLGLMDGYGQKGRIEDMNRVATDMILKSTQEGRAIKALDLANRYDPQSWSFIAAKYKAKSGKGKELTTKEYATGKQTVEKYSERSDQLELVDEHISENRAEKEALEAEADTIGQAINESKKIELEELKKEVEELKKQLAEAKEDRKRPPASKKARELVKEIASRSKQNKAVLQVFLRESERGSFILSQKEKYEISYESTGLPEDVFNAFRDLATEKLLQELPKGEITLKVFHKYLEGQSQGKLNERQRDQIMAAAVNEIRQTKEHELTPEQLRKQTNRREFYKKAYEILGEPARAETAKQREAERVEIQKQREIERSYKEQEKELKRQQDILFRARKKFEENQDKESQKQFEEEYKEAQRQEKEAQAETDRQRREFEKEQAKQAAKQAKTAIVEGTASPVDKWNKQLIETAATIGADEIALIGANVLKITHNLTKWRNMMHELFPDFKRQDFNAVYRNAYELKAAVDADLKRLQAEKRVGAKLTDEEYAGLQQQQKKARHHVMRSRAELEGFYKHLSYSTARKVGKGIRQATNAFRTLQTGLDASYAGRQGAALNGMETIESLKAFWEGAKKSLTEEEFDNFIYEMENDPIAQEMSDYGWSSRAVLKNPLDFEEFYLSSIPMKLADIGTNQKTKLGQILNKPFARAATKIPRVLGEGFKLSERMFELQGDLQGYNIYRKWKADLEAIKRDNPNIDLDKAKRQLIRIINAGTGRGNLKAVFGQGGIAQDFLTEVLYSPRFLLSRPEFVAYTNPIGIALTPKGARRINAKASMKMYGKVAAIFLPLAALGLTSLDPEDDEFMKIRYGDQSWDITGKLNEPLRQLFMAAKSAWYYGMTQSDDKELTKTGEAGLDRIAGYYTDAADWGRYFRGKMSPQASLAVDRMFKEDYLGRPFTWTNAIATRATPLGAQNLWSALVYDEKEAMMRNPVTFKTFGQNVENLAQGKFNKNLSRVMFSFVPDEFGLSAANYPKEESTTADLEAARLMKFHPRPKEADKEEELIEGTPKWRIVNSLVRLKRIGHDISKDIEKYKTSGDLTDKDVKSIEAKAEKLWIEQKMDKATTDQVIQVLRFTTPYDWFMQPFLTKNDKNRAIERERLLQLLEKKTISADKSETLTEEELKNVQTVLPNVELPAKKDLATKVAKGDIASITKLYNEQSSQLTSEQRFEITRKLKQKVVNSFMRRTLSKEDYDAAKAILGDQIKFRFVEPRAKQKPNTQGLKSLENAY